MRAGSEECVPAQLRESEALRLKGRLGTGGGSGSGSRKFSASFMRQLSMQPSGSTWQVQAGPLAPDPNAIEKSNAERINSNMKSVFCCMQLAIDDLVKSPTNKVFPFVKLLLAENAGLAQAASPDAAAGADAASQVQALPCTACTPPTHHLQCPHCFI